ncbi:SDR family NAD(P)-dependent oxidoreductase [Jannaschia sp. CCS1]|uniref:SDR family NAD(P)-dependent oxidoreductase n=1 Tax=Jannaschia sp. (strain CCS1) TaxID=290400 RepID=UPI000053C3A1|nr:SDR family oxidoreductase [Jannaschia sp. CCS1]ABD56704.1 short-chain dehydrogenase/reductase SDR [Jannaschia sp. CCS1]
MRGRRLEDRACIVTGGAKGMGLEFTRALLAEGAQVLAADIAPGQEAEAAGATYINADITASDGPERIVKACRDTFGSLDVLVNNAALYATLPVARYDDIDTATWARVIDTNVTGTYGMIRAAGPVMEAQGHGKIVNITSGTVYKGMPGMLHYIASKGAIHAMTRALSRELGDAGICVNNLAPGLTLSSSVLENADHVDAARAAVLASRAIKRDGHPADLLGALVFLCSGESDFVTGQTIAVDGGSVNT